MSVGADASSAPRLAFDAQRTGATGQPQASLVQLHDLADRAQEWRRLAAHALEPNAFLDPGFALAAAQHTSFGPRPQALIVHDAAERGGDLIGLVPLIAPEGSPGRVTRVWRTNMMPLGTPLLDRARAGAAVSCLFDWFERTSCPTQALVIPGVPADGPVAQAFRLAAHGRRLPIESFDRHTRALLPAGDAQAILRRTISGSRWKEYRRLRRRLGEQGDLRLVTATDLESCKNALERFLRLEAGGWKGRKGTALVQTPALTTFARTMVRSLASQGRCRIFELMLDAHPVASGIVLSSGSRDYFWKIAYDESFASYSPGVLLTLELSEAQLADGRIEATDSCAMADHPMIDRLWPERVAICDLMIATKRAGNFERLVSREALRRDLRSRAKQSYLRLRKG